MKKSFLLTTFIGSLFIVPYIIGQAQFGYNGNNGAQYSTLPQSFINFLSPGNNISFTTNGQILTIASTGGGVSTPVSVANGGTASTTTATAGTVVGTYNLVTFANLGTTVPSYQGQMLFNYGGANNISPVYWASGTSAGNWVSFPDFVQGAQIGDANNAPTNSTGTYPLYVTANGYIGNQTNGLQNVNAQICIQTKNMAYEGFAGMFGGMGSNHLISPGLSSGYTSIDQNAVQFGAVNQGGTENLFSGDIGMIYDQGFPVVFGTPINIGSDSTTPNHEQFGIDSTKCIVHFPFMQAGIYTHTNVLNIDALQVSEKTGFVTVYSNLLYGGYLFLGTNSNTNSDLQLNTLLGLNYAAGDQNTVVESTNYLCTSTTSSSVIGGYLFANNGGGLTTTTSGDIKLGVGSTTSYLLTFQGSNLRFENNSDTLSWGPGGSYRSYIGSPAANTVSINDSSAVVGNGILQAATIEGGCIMTANSGGTNVVFNALGEWETVYNTSASTLGTITINLPTATKVGQQIRYFTAGVGTAATTTGGTFTGATFTTLAANSSLCFQAINTTGTFIRVQ